MIPLIDGRMWTPPPANFVRIFVVPVKGLFMANLEPPLSVHSSSRGVLAGKPLKQKPCILKASY